MWVQCIDCIHYDDYSLKKEERYMSIIDTPEFMAAALEDKINQSLPKDPARELATEIFKFLLPQSNTDTTVVLAALSMVLATVAVEAGMEEEKAVYAFRKSYGNAARRLKRLMRGVQ